MLGLSLALPGSQTASALAPHSFWNPPYCEGLLCARCCAEPWSCCGLMRWDLKSQFSCPLSTGYFHCEWSGLPQRAPGTPKFSRAGKGLCLPKLVCLYHTGECSGLDPEPAFQKPWHLLPLGFYLSVWAR